MDRVIECEARVRSQLEHLARDLDPLRFTKMLPETMSVIIPPFSQVNCEQYAIGTNGFRHSIPALYPKLDSHQAGDLVLYHDEDKGIVHVGRLQDDDSVVSKWGDDGPVLKHPIDMVPSSYGSWVFFRRIPEERLSAIQGKDILDMIE